jgi:hypothetical protein
LNHRPTVIGIVAGIAALAGCGTAHIAGVPANRIQPVAASSLPPSLNGLRVSEENVRPAISHQRDTYLDSLGFFALRRDTQVEATLEVGHLSSQAKPSSPGFQMALVNEIGGSAPQSAVLAGDTVYFTTGTKQRVMVWFRGRWMMILSVRDDYATPRDLLRAALGVSPT